MVAPRIPLPGKIVGVVEGKVLKKTAFISVEEHVANCAAFFDFVSPDGNETLRNALLFHDIGKKLFRIGKIYKGTPLKDWAYDTSSDDKVDRLALLKQDYTATMRPDIAEPISENTSMSEVAKAYLGYVGLGEGRGKKTAEKITTYPLREDPTDSKSEVVSVNYRLERPFGNHAAPIETCHLPESLEDRDLLASIIRQHHSFQVANIIPEVEKYELFDHLLYDLMTMDHLGSSWAERLILSEEEGFKREFPPSVDFGEVDSRSEGTPTVSENLDGTKTIATKVKLKSHGREEAEVSFSVTYFVEEVDYVDPGIK